MAITTQDQLIASLPGQHRHFYKLSQTSEGAGTLQSMWKATGQPGAGATPPAFSAGSGYVPTSATAGAFPFVDPGGGNTAYLGRLAVSLPAVGTVILYDRLWACSGFGTVSTSLQSVTTPGALTRPDALGTDVEMWLEVYGAPGATGANWTVTYTDQDNNGSASSVYAHPANAETVGQMVPMPLASGDTGVRSVQSFQASTTSGTAGDVGITLLRRIAEVPMFVANSGMVLDAFSTGLPVLSAGTCMAMAVLTGTTATGSVMGATSVVTG